MAYKDIQEHTHVVDLGNSKKALLDLKDIYTNIGTIVGITKLTGAAPADAIGADLNYLLRNGEIARVAVRVKVGTATKTQRRMIYCSMDKVGQALGQLSQKALETGAVIQRKGIIPRRRKLTA